VKAKNKVHIIIGCFIAVALPFLAHVILTKYFDAFLDCMGYGIGVLLIIMILTMAQLRKTKTFFKTLLTLFILVEIYAFIHTFILERSVKNAYKAIIQTTESVYRLCAPQTLVIVEQERELEAKILEEMSSNYLLSQQGIDTLKNTLATYKAILDRRIDLGNQCEQVFYTSLRDKLGSNSEINKDALDGYSETIKIMRQFFTVQNQEIVVINNIISLFEKNLNKINVKDGQYVFDNINELAKYNALLMELANCANQEKAIITKIQSIKTQGIKDIEVLSKM